MGGSVEDRLDAVTGLELFLGPSAPLQLNDARTFERPDRAVGGFEVDPGVRVDPLPLRWLPGWQVGR